MDTQSDHNRPASQFIDALIESVDEKLQDKISEIGDNIIFADTFEIGITLDIMDDGDDDRIWLNGIESRIRRSRHASSVLSRICKLADLYGITLSLAAKAYNPDNAAPATTEDGLLCTEDLVAWYSRYGFRITGYEDEQTLMERSPQKVQDCG